VSKYFYGRIQP